MRGSLRWVATILAGLCSVAAAEAPLPPAVLEPYIHNGRFDPGDYGWMRGRFPDATPAEKATIGEIAKWLQACRRASEAETRAKLAAMGIVDARLEQSGITDTLCGAVAHAPFQLEAKSFGEFQQALAQARPVADTYLMAVAQAERIGAARGPSLADALLARPLGEQMIRTALGWGSGEMQHAPPLTADAQAIVIARLGMALQSRDRENTEWLRGIITKEGWPKVSQIGERASQQAWLLVQHADADPSFQLQALRLMEPLLKSGEVTKQNYAYLYDRVMLKLTGRQRYATQAMCRDGALVAQPLEDQVAVERLRAEMGLNPLPTYMAEMNKMAGGCRPEHPAAPSR